ncbi:hypothetical protein K438DRAFT_1877945 [Mycena galopus ATCC 62051]|nr:hypothetical protein K438DRAFT_1877945 [Mycena galopus ATCC 62051]
MAARLGGVSARVGPVHGTQTFWGNTVRMEKQLCQGYALYVIANSVTGAMVDTFLIRRLYRLSNMYWLAVFLSICVAVGLVDAIIISVSQTGGDFSRNKAATGVVIFIVGTTTVDILIAVSLIWKLVTMKTSFVNISSLIHRLVVGAFQTGSTTSTVAVAVVVAYYLDKESNVPGVFNYLMSPLYVATLL